MPVMETLLTQLIEQLDLPALIMFALFFGVAWLLRKDIKSLREDLGGRLDVLERKFDALKERYDQDIPHIKSRVDIMWDRDIPDIKSRLGGLEQTASNIQERLGKLEPAVVNIQERLGKLEPAVANIQERLGKLEPVVANIQERVGKLEPAVSNIQERLGKLEPVVANIQERLGKLEPVVANIQERLGKLEPAVTDIKSRVGIMWDRDTPEIKNRLGGLERIIPDLRSEIMELSPQNHPKTAPVASNSPMVLNDIGKRIAKKIGAREFLKEHNAELKARVEKRNPQSPYDLQSACFYVADMEMPDMMPLGMLDIAKKEAFKRGLRLSFVLFIIAILLRDEMMAERGWEMPKKDENTSADDLSRCRVKPA